MNSKEVQPLSEVFKGRIGLLVRVYYKSVPCVLSSTKQLVTVDEYTHGLSTGRFNGDLPVLIPCDPISPREMADYYLPDSAVWFTRQPTEGQRVRRELPRFPGLVGEPKRFRPRGAGRKGGRKQGLSAEEKKTAAKVARLYERGQSVSAIRQELHLGRATVYRHLETMGVPRTWSWRETDKSRIQNLRSER